MKMEGLAVDVVQVDFDELFIFQRCLFCMVSSREARREDLQIQVLMADITTRVLVIILSSPAEFQSALHFAIQSTLLECRPIHVHTYTTNQ